jgi:voltage-gated potassium channel
MDTAALDTSADITAATTVATPAEELSTFVSGAAALFFWAEEGYNDGITSYWDALHYISTSLSVGYANVFPVTQLGKTIGTVVQMIGPALSARALDSADKPDSAGNDNAAVVARLDAILEELRRQRTPPSSR